MQARQRELEGTIVEQQVQIMKFQCRGATGLSSFSNAPVMETAGTRKSDGSEGRIAAEVPIKADTAKESAEQAERVARAEREAREKLERAAMENVEREERERIEREERERFERKERERLEREEKERFDREEREERDRLERKERKRLERERLEREKEQIEREEKEKADRKAKKREEEKRKATASKIPSALGAKNGDRSRETSALAQKEKKNEWADTWGSTETTDESPGLPPIITSSVPGGIFDGAGKFDLFAKTYLPGGGGGGNAGTISMPTLPGNGDRQSTFTDTARDQKRENQRENLVEGFLGSSPPRKRNDSPIKPTPKPAQVPSPPPAQKSGRGWGGSLLNTIANAAITITVPDRTPSPEPAPVKPKIEEPPRWHTPGQPPKSQPAGFCLMKPAWGNSTGGNNTGTSRGGAITKSPESGRNTAGPENIPESAVEIKQVPAPGRFYSSVMDKKGGAGESQDDAWGWGEGAKDKDSKASKPPSPTQEPIEQTAEQPAAESEVETEEAATPASA